MYLVRSGRGTAARRRRARSHRAIHQAAADRAVPRVVRSRRAAAGHARPRGRPARRRHGVLVLPGLFASDSSTIPLRAFLRHLGYDVRGWDLGRNHGPTDMILAGLPQALLDHAERTGRPVSVIGWSLGGVYARELARRPPEGPSGHHPGQPVHHDGIRGRPTPTARSGGYGICTPTRPRCPPSRSGPGRSACRRRRCTPAWTAWWPGRRASSRRPRCTRTSRSGAAISVSAWTRRRSG